MSSWFSAVLNCESCRSEEPGRAPRGPDPTASVRPTETGILGGFLS